MTTTPSLGPIKDNDAVIVAVSRTPIGSFGGSLSGYSALDLGRLAVEGLLSRASTVGILPTDVDEVLLGNVLGANLGQNVARQVSLAAGLPTETVSTSVNKVCASGLKAITLAAAAIRAGDAEVVVAGGTESMSNTPYYLPQHRWGSKFGCTSATVVDGLHRDGLSNAANGLAMGFAGDESALEAKVSRESADSYAVGTYKRAQTATKGGLFKGEIVAVAKNSPQSKGKPDENEVLEYDEGIYSLREDKVPRLKPSFNKENGVCTPANSSPLSDGAAAVLLVSGRKYRELVAGGKMDPKAPIFRVASYADFEVEPMRFPFSPIHSLGKALSKVKLSVGDLAAVEINEAFAVVPLIVSEGLKIPIEKVNTMGGAVALGHPLGASGARVLITLTSVLANCTKGEENLFGAATICNGGGGSTSIVIESFPAGGAK